MKFNEQVLTNARRATQLLFLACGLGISCWAPMVPYAKDRLGLNDGQLGLLLLFLGGGALLIMPLTGMLISKYGSRIIVAIAVVLMAIILPFLLLVTSVILMAVFLLLFGAAAGSIDVAMNAHGAQVEQLYGRKIMSSLHGLYSVGGLVGSLGLGFLIKLGLQPVHAAISIAILLIVILFTQYSSLLHPAQSSTTTASQSGNGRFSWLNGSVIFLGVLCFSAFLAEGAMLDWSAVFLRDIKGVTPAFSGAGYAAFSIAMAIMRLIGDKLVERLSSRVIVSGGSILAAVGLIIAILSPWPALVLAGFILLGAGAANVVPVFFSNAGTVANMAVISTMGYAGQLAGPAILGLVAQHSSLNVSFAGCAVLFLFIAFAKKSI